MDELREISFGEFLKPRTGIYAPDATEIRRLQRISKISFEGELVTGGQKLTKTNQIIVHPKDLVFSGLNIEKGAICINETGHHLAVSTNYNSLEVDYEVVDISFLKFLLISPYFRKILIENLPKDYSFTRPKKLLPIKISIPDIDSQRQTSQYLHKMAEGIFELGSEISNKSEYLLKLRQAMLQEAIEGKLTAEWRKKNSKLISGENHASKLLEKIRAEKNHLIKEGKMRKEKPLPTIKAAEEPFALPDGWVWCRLIDIAQGFEYGSSSKSSKSGKVPVLRMGNIQNGTISWDKLVFSNDDNEISQYALRVGDLLFNRTNSRELVGKTAVFAEEREAIFAGYLVRFHMLGGISEHFVNEVMNSSYHRSWCNEVKADALGQSNINATKLRSYILPLPPIAEQEAVVERVDKIKGFIVGLEEQMLKCKEQSEMLMQSVLREAFEHSHA